MAMNFASPESADDPDLLVDMNTTPLIDVMLVLLIMLIITIPIQLHAVNLDMPAGNPPLATTPPEVLRIAIGGHGDVVWNGVAVSDSAELEERLEALAAQANPPEIHIRPERTSPYRSVARVMAAIQRHGLKKIGLVGNERFI